MLREAEKKMHWATEFQHLKNELIDAPEAIQPQACNETDELKGSLHLKDLIIAQLKRDFAETNTVLSTSCLDEEKGQFVIRMSEERLKIKEAR
ncbi:hypothetical protein DYB36_013642, partial [Aphanomyces astaci]